MGGTSRVLEQIGVTVPFTHWQVQLACTSGEALNRVANIANHIMITVMASSLKVDCYDNHHKSSPYPKELVCFPILSSPNAVVGGPFSPQQASREKTR